MAYSTSAPPVCILQAIAGPRIWHHTSADATAAADASGFITNGGSLDILDPDGKRLAVTGSQSKP